MVRSFVVALFATLLVAFTGSAFAQAPSGTAAEAKALLEKAVVAVKADPKKAIEDFNNPNGSFRDRDLYVLCAVARRIQHRVTSEHGSEGNPLSRSCR